jgi:putative transposase
MKNKSALPVMHLHEGAVIVHADREYVILKIADMNLLLVREKGSSTECLLRLDSVSPLRKIGPDSETPDVQRDLNSVSTYDWGIAQQRLDWIQPMLDGRAHYATTLAKQIAAEAEVSRATIYRWVQAYRQSYRLSSLLPDHASRGRQGKRRLVAAVETLIADTIENFHLSPQKPSLNETIEEIRRLCNNLNLPAPAINTIRSRVIAKLGRDATKRRHGEAVAHDTHDPIISKIHDADWPLAKVQIDHTILPVIIVDDQHRKSIRRAWVTFSIDVFSRVCLGMHLALDDPSAMSAGMCIAHSILPKDKWLRQIGVTSIEWPMWGVMSVLHMDNAKEFRGDMLKVACKEYAIDIQFRPVKKPRYGAHIERLMGTMSEKLKPVSGATFSGPEEKGAYDAEEMATMTFSELEKWLVLAIAKYHSSLHTGIGTTPIQKWREGLLGTKGKPARGLPPRIQDEQKLRIDFMPFEERTVQPYGVLWDVEYYHDVLRPYVSAKDPTNKKVSRKFRFHRDPRDISVIYFYDELSKRFVAIPNPRFSIRPNF